MESKVDQVTKTCESPFHGAEEESFMLIPAACAGMVRKSKKTQLIARKGLERERGE